MRYYKSENILINLKLFLIFRYKSGNFYGCKGFKKKCWNLAISKFFCSFEKAGIKSSDQISKSICEAVLCVIDAIFGRIMANYLRDFLKFSDFDYLI